MTYSIFHEIGAKKVLCSASIPKISLVGVTFSSSRMTLGIEGTARGMACT